MRLVFFCEPGSPSFVFTPDDIYGRGLGGAEISLVSLAESLAALGHDVSVYNCPKIAGIYNGVRYENAVIFNPFDPCDVFVLYRNPSNYLPFVNSKINLWWSTDQFTQGDYATEIIPFIHHAVVISEYHKRYHIEHYNIESERITAIDLGVRLQDGFLKSIEKIPNQLLYCSVPDRGLAHLAKLFPALRHLLSDLDPAPTLAITSDYSLWGEGIEAHNDKFREMFEGMDGVRFLGKIPRRDLVELQMQSDILAYPNQPVNGLTELFGVSVAEAQVAGAIPVTSRFGAFETTVLPQGILIGDAANALHPIMEEYQSRFIDAIVRLLSNRDELVKRQNALRTNAIGKFNWAGIAKQWTALIDRVMEQNYGSSIVQTRE